MTVLYNALAKGRLMRGGQLKVESVEPGVRVTNSKITFGLAVTRSSLRSWREWSRFATRSLSRVTNGRGIARSISRTKARARSSGAASAGSITSNASTSKPKGNA
jgi:hypothetical protein